MPTSSRPCPISDIAWSSSAAPSNSPAGSSTSPATTKASLMPASRSRCRISASSDPPREVGRHAEAVSRQPLGELYSGPGSLTRRGSNREGYVLWDMLDDRFLRPLEGYHLVAGMPQKLCQPPVRPLSEFGVLLRRHVLPHRPTSLLSGPLRRAGGAQVLLGLLRFEEDTVCHGG